MKKAKIVYLVRDKNLHIHGIFKSKKDASRLVRFLLSNINESVEVKKQKGVVLFKGKERILFMIGRWGVIGPRNKNPA